MDLLTSAVPDAAVPISGGSPVTSLARGLHGRGHDVVVATLAHGVDRVIRCSGPRLEVVICPYRPQRRARDAFAVERRALGKALIETSPEVVHAHWTYEFALAGIATGIPTLVTVRDWAPTILWHHRIPYRVVRLGMAAAVFARARHLTVTSPYLEDLLRRWARRRADIVPNAVDDDDFRPARTIPTPSAQAPVLVAINNGWGHRKNVQTLLRALPLVRRQVPDTTLTLVGAGYGPNDDAESWARREGLTTGVRFLGALPRAVAMSVLAAGDVFVHPSREESFGLVLVEAMARGVPVVAGSDSGAVPWVCGHGTAGVLTDIQDEAALGEAIAGVLRDPRRARDLAIAAHEHARTRFSLSTVLGRYEQLYGRLAAEERP